jgi:hypothetical protein
VLGTGDPVALNEVHDRSVRSYAGRAVPGRAHSVDEPTQRKSNRDETDCGGKVDGPRTTAGRVGEEGEDAHLTATNPARRCPAGRPSGWTSVDAGAGPQASVAGSRPSGAIGPPATSCNKVLPPPFASLTPVNHGPLACSLPGPY